LRMEKKWAGGEPQPGVYAEVKKGKEEKKRKGGWAICWGKNIIPRSQRKGTGSLRENCGMDSKGGRKTGPRDSDA